MSDPVPSSAISDATTGGLSVIVITGGSTGQVLTLQANGTYAPATVSAGIGGSVGSTDNRLVRSDGTGGSTVQSTGITVDDANNVSGAGTVGCGAITSTGASSISQNSSSPTLALSNTTGLQARLTDGTRTVGLLAFTSSGVDALLIRNGTNTGNANLEAYRGTFAICRAMGNIIGESLVFVGMYTVATLPSAYGNDRAIAVVTDSSVAMSGNYGATVSGGGGNKVKVFSNGTNWLIA